jgi:cyclohexa-1,5-dienecarbonyl-CoA hydratase
VTLQRPPLNVLDIPTIRALHDALFPLLVHRDLKVLVLRSGLEGVFSAGVDVLDHTRERAGAMLDAFHRVFRLLDALPQASIAAVDGRCLGGGCELAAFCDFVLASPRSAFGQPEIDVGCFPPVAAVWLPRVLGRAAWELVLTGAPVTAAEAARIGLVTRVSDDVEQDAAALAARLGGKSAAVLALARRALRRGGEGAFEDALGRMERVYREELLATQDCEEGVRAFLEKRKPRWSDR